MPRTPLHNERVSKIRQDPPIDKLQPMSQAKEKDSRQKLCLPRLAVLVGRTFGLVEDEAPNALLPRSCQPAGKCWENHKSLYPKKRPHQDRNQRSSRDRGPSEQVAVRASGVARMSTFVAIQGYPVVACPYSNSSGLCSMWVNVARV